MRNGGEAEHEMAIELRGIRGGQIVRKEEVRRGDRRKIAPGLAEEIADHAAGHIVDIERALTQDPDGDGFKLCARFQSNDRTRDIPVSRSAIAVMRFSNLGSTFLRFFFATTDIPKAFRF